MLGRILRKVRREVRLLREPAAEALLPLRRSLPLPKGTTEPELREFVATVHPAGAPAEEMARYGQEDFGRFILTLGLTGGLTGKCLELGANPYFLTMLLHRFSTLELTVANYFGTQLPVGPLEQQVCYRDWRSGSPEKRVFAGQHFNIESDPFPYPDAAYEVVLFCEILEHLLHDPLRPLREINRVLKRNGVLIVTTPNVARLENIARLVAGENIYDPYSGYGPYGRHNREYTLDELKRLLNHAGFEIEEAFTADVHANHTNRFAAVSKLVPLVQRPAELGQYLFVKARNVRHPKPQRLDWLYRSFQSNDG